MRASSTAGSHPATDDRFEDGEDGVAQEIPDGNADPGEEAGDGGEDPDNEHADVEGDDADPGEQVEQAGGRHQHGWSEDEQIGAAVPQEQEQEGADVGGERVGDQGQQVGERGEDRGKRGAPPRGFGEPGPAVTTSQGGSALWETGDDEGRADCEGDRQTREPRANPAARAYRVDYHVPTVAAGGSVVTRPVIFRS